MEHLTETQLNEYLDGLMESPEQVRMEAHLSGCADCRARLASLQTVYRALAALPEETPTRDLTSSVLQALPRGFTGLGWRLAFAIQTGMSLGFLLLLFPFMLGWFPGIMPGWNGRLTVPEVGSFNPIDFHFSLPVLHLSHPPILVLPVIMTHSNLTTWLVLGIAAALLFAVGNFSLIFHGDSTVQK
jgi:predicted anti-sigma-YlaC factor YlaD